MVESITLLGVPGTGKQPCLEYDLDWLLLFARGMVC